MRGKPLDEDCRKALCASHEWGASDDRVYCYGLLNSMTDDLFLKCYECKANVRNSEPPEVRHENAVQQ